MCTVASSILEKFETDAAVGFELLSLIRRKYSHISPRELAALVDSAVDARNKGKSPGEAMAIFKNVCYQFNNTPEISQLMSLFYMKMFDSPQAKAKILDCPHPDLSLSAVEVALEDFTSTVTNISQGFNPTVSNNSQVFTVRNNGNRGGRRSFERNLDEVICLRCQLPGHFARNCTAPAPASATGVPTKDALAYNTTASSGFSWMTSDVVLPNSSKYLLDSGSTIHISVQKDHFEDFKTISGKIFGIAEEALEVKGIGSVKLIHPVTGHEITLHDVHYVPDATQNLLSIKRASKFGSFHFSEEKVHFTQHGSADQLQIGSVEGSLYFSDYLPSINIANGKSMHAKLKYKCDIHGQNDVYGYSASNKAYRCVTSSVDKEGSLKNGRANDEFCGKSDDVITPSNVDVDVSVVSNEVVEVDPKSSSPLEDVCCNECSTSSTDEVSDLDSVGNQKYDDIEEIVDVQDENPIGIGVNMCELSNVYESDMKECNEVSNNGSMVSNTDVSIFNSMVGKLISAVNMMSSKVFKWLFAVNIIKAVVYYVVLGFPSFISGVKNKEVCMSDDYKPKSLNGFNFKNNMVTTTVDDNEMENLSSRNINQIFENNDADVEQDGQNNDFEKEMINTEHKANDDVKKELKQVKFDETSEIRRIH